MVDSLLVEKIKRQLVLVDLVGQVVDLKKNGSNHLGLCPFVAERTPSFHVYDDHYHCFGCGAHGDVISWFQRKGDDFSTALEAAARLARVDLPVATPRDREAEDRRAKVLAALEWACARFVAALPDSPGDSHLAGRGLRIDPAFRVGWADGVGLIEAAGAAGHSVEVLVAAGLVSRAEDGRVYEFFRRRLTIPILSGGKVIAFTARAMPRDLEAATAAGKPIGKYINSRSSEVYNKSEHLFNADRGLSAARLAGNLIIVEGALDVLALSQIGVRQVVAPLGTSFGPGHVAGLRFDGPVALAFDHEPEKAQVVERTLDALRTLLRAGLDARIVTWPGKDPADLVAAGAGDQVTAAIASGKDGWQVLVGSVAPHPVTMTDRERMAALDNLAEVIHGAPDDRLRQMRLGELAKHLRINSKIAGRSLADPKPSLPKPSERSWWRYSCTELGNAERFRDALQDSVRYVVEWGWVVWTGTHWAQDEAAAWRRYVTAIDAGIAADILAAKAGKDDDAEDDLRRWRDICKSKRNADESMELASRLEELRDQAETYNSDPNLIATPSGTVDLRTGTISAANPSDRITRIYNAAWKGLDYCDQRWDRFVRHLFGDRSVHDYMHRYLGYSATGLRREKSIVLMQGDGDNGKSLFAESIWKVMGFGPGGYAATLDPDNFLNQGQPQKRWEVANADQARFVFVEEASGGGQRGFAVDFLKSASGGNPMTAERKGSQPYTFLPTWKLLFLCNQLPSAPGGDQAAWNRINVVRTSPPPAVLDRTLKEHFATPEARSAILAWIVRGAVAYHLAGGLHAPETVTDWTKHHRGECDHLMSAIFDLYAPGPSDASTLTTSSVLAAISEWYGQQGLQSKPTAKQIMERLRPYGVDRSRTTITERDESGMIVQRGKVRCLTGIQRATDMDNEAAWEDRRRELRGLPGSNPDHQDPPGGPAGGPSGPGDGPTSPAGPRPTPIAGPPDHQNQPRTTSDQTLVAPNTSVFQGDIDDRTTRTTSPRDVRVGAPAPACKNTFQKIESGEEGQVVLVVQPSRQTATPSPDENLFDDQVIDPIEAEERAAIQAEPIPAVVQAIATALDARVLTAEPGPTGDPYAIDEIDADPPEIDIATQPGPNQATWPGDLRRRHADLTRMILTQRFGILLDPDGKFRTHHRPVADLIAAREAASRFAHDHLRGLLAPPDLRRHPAWITPKRTP